MSGFSVGFGAPDPALGNPLRKRNPYVSDDPSGGITGQGPLYDNPDNRETGDFGQGLMRSTPSSVNVYGTAPTTGYSSDTFNDVPTERSATPTSLTIPTRQNLNPPSDYSYSETGLPQGAHEPQTTSAGRIVPNSVNPNEDDTSPNYGDPRSLSRRAYDEYAAARTDPSLKPHASIGRQILGNVIDRFGGGMLHPLADVARYGVHHTQNMQTAQDDLGAAKDIWGAAAKEQGLEQTDRYHQELVAQRMANAQTRQDALNARTFGQGVNQAIAGQNMAEKSFAEPLPAEIQQPAKQFTMPGRNDAADVAAGSDMPPALTLPSRITSPGMTVQGHSPDYRVAQIPSMPTWGGAGDKVVTNPPTAVQIPPREVQLQKAQEAKAANNLPLPSDVETQYHVPPGTKFPPEQWVKLVEGGQVSPTMLALRAAKGNKDAQLAMRLIEKQKESIAINVHAANNPQADPKMLPSENRTYDISEVPAIYRGTVEAVHDGREKMPTIPRGKAGEVSTGMLINAWVNAIDPSWNEQRAGVRKQYLVQGMPRDNIQSANTLIQHLSLLRDLSKSLNNPDVRLLAAARNMARTELGDPEVTNGQTALTAVANEAERAFKGTNPNEAGVQQFRNSIQIIRNSPAQSEGQIKNMVKLLAGRVKQLDTGYRMSGAKKDFTIISPESRQVLEQLGMNPSTFESPADAAGGGKQAQGGEKIRVRKKATGKTGTIDPGDFDAAKYDKL